MNKILRIHIILLFVLAVTNGNSQTYNKDTDILQNAALGINWNEIERPNYPSYTDRVFWDSLPENWKQQYINEGEKYVDYTWPSVTASSYLRFMQDGDRKAMEEINNERRLALGSLVMAELIEGQGRFLNPIIDGVFAFCEQTSWCNSAHLVVQKAKGSLPDVTEPIIDLGAVITGENLAMIHYFFREEFDKVNPLISERIEYEISHRLLQPYYERDDFWWMGFKGSFVNNWNVWCNANVLKCMWLIEEDPIRRAEGISKIIRSADKFVDYYKNDGACEEGPEYWGHAGGKLYELIETLHTMSGGEFRPYTHEKVKNIGRYIGLVNIAGNSFVNFADASPKLSSYPGLIKRIGTLIEDEALEDFARKLALSNRWSEHPPKGNLGKVIPNLMLGVDWLSEQTSGSAELSHFFNETGLCIARDESNKSTGFVFAAKGGHNGESHNHNDVGTFILYYNAAPFLVDAGVGTYVKKTFSSRRYEIWNMQSEYHNLPLINGLGQKDGRRYKAAGVQFDDDGKRVTFKVNMQTAYPQEADIKALNREYTFMRTEGLLISDQYELKKCIQPAEYHFITPCDITEVASGKLSLNYNQEQLYIYFDARELEWRQETIGEMDERLSRNWPNGLTRIVFKETKKSKRRTNKFKVLKH